MLERTFRFWHRWVGPDAAGAQAATATAVAEDAQAERRLWVRYAADLQAQVQLPDRKTQVSAARVRDISRGGASLIWDREVPPGQLLNIDLPHASANAVQTVLACVVRSRREHDGQWSLGCVFSRELTDEDLVGFGACRERTQADDQRTWRRFECNLKARFQRIGAVESETQEASLLNISPSGVGLLTNSQIDAGSLLNLDLVGKLDTPLRTILACVVHVTQRSEGQWALGCNFIRELNEEDFQALIDGV